MLLILQLSLLVSGSELQTYSSNINQSIYSLARSHIRSFKHYEQPILNYQESYQSDIDNRTRSLQVKENHQIRNLICHKEFCVEGVCKDGNCICDRICHYGCSFGCLKTGTCIQNQCVCNQGYTDLDCSSHYRDYYHRNCPGLEMGLPCQGITCSSNGICQGQYRKTSKCPNNCSGEDHGVCNNFHRCQCLTPWTGLDCSELRPPPEVANDCPYNCNRNGYCDTNNLCVCNQGWSDMDCSFKVPGWLELLCYECLPNKCGIACVTLHKEPLNVCFQGEWKDFQCICDYGYYGVYCDLRCSQCLHACPPSCLEGESNINYTFWLGVACSTGVIAILACLCYVRRIRLENQQLQAIRNPANRTELDIYVSNRSQVVHNNEQVQNNADRQGEIELQQFQDPEEVQNLGEGEGNYRLPPEQIQIVQNNLTRLDQPQKCPICTENINDQPYRKLVCPSQHAVHTACLASWLDGHDQCPALNCNARIR